jgi:hypothetical protein
LGEYGAWTSICSRFWFAVGMCHLRCEWTNLGNLVMIWGCEWFGDDLVPLIDRKKQGEIMFIVIHNMLDYNVCW